MFVPRRPFWMRWLAILFGRRTATRNGSITVIGYWWRGRFYIIKEIKHDRRDRRRRSF